MKKAATTKIKVNKRWVEVPAQSVPEDVEVWDEETIRKQLMEGIRRRIEIAAKRPGNSMDPNWKPPKPPRPRIRRKVLRA